MSLSAERIKQDLRKIDELSIALKGRIRIKSTEGNPANRIIVVINYPTAPSKDYPAKVQQETEVKIELLSRYPFQEPSATITTPVYHPNVYESGQICFGTKWLPTEGLDLLIKRIIQIITFDNTILNGDSPANGMALKWYRSVIRQHPEAFPTSKLLIKEEPKKKMAWNNVEKAEDEKVVVSCPACNASLRVPVGKKLKGHCPKCRHGFLVST